MALRTLALLLLLRSFISVAAAADFSLQPRLCLHHAHEACVLKLKVSWQQDSKACLYKKADPSPLLCASSINQHLQLELTEHTSFELRNLTTGELLAERQIKVLQVDLNASDQLLKRSRNSWGNP
ncbi:DUF3019 domain-containing protein [Rheinheimera sp.]|uniref:DUF3019 domain-containing protein n=1 Tax=Rheinheimera sp. TaxID=1869214 RepID=UPI0026100516|nr:DUF3019 domain-containing protein [Rheinheimera sp.]MCA1930636.1 DUF3019 domain-containing protein [Rheinheimera sp.]